MKAELRRFADGPDEGGREREGLGRGPWAMLVEGWVRGAEMRVLLGPGKFERLRRHLSTGEA